MSATYLEQSSPADFDRSAFERFDALADHDDGSAETYANNANEYLRRAVAHVIALDAFWNQLCTRAYRESAEPLHAIRDKIDLIWRLRADSLNDIKVIGERVVQLSGQRPPAWSHLQEAEAVVARFATDVLDRWQTLEDLEELLLARISIPNERLIPLAQKCPAPQSWHDEAVDPFAKKG